MRLLFTISVIIFSIISTTGQTINPNYDSELAKKLGADDYGMKKYVFVILKTGSNKSTNKELIDSYFKGYMNNINRLVEAKKLIVERTEWRFKNSLAENSLMIFAKG